MQVSAAFEMNLQAFLAYCRGNLSCQYGRAGDPGAKLPALMQRLDNKPTPVGKRMLTRALAMSGVLNTLYDPRAWSTLDSALSAADQANGQLLLTLADLRVRRHADGSYENFLDATAAITCLDHPIPWDIATYRQLGPALASASPLFGPTFQYTSYLACSNWPIKPKGTVAALSADGAPPILLVDATGDLSPYVWAQAVNKQLGGSVLLTRNGFGHVSYDKSSCARQAEDAYLIDLTLPAPGTVCESDFQ